MKQWVGPFLDNKWVMIGLFVLITTPLYLQTVHVPDAFKNLTEGRYLHLAGKFPHYSTFTLAPVKNYVYGDVYDWLGSLLLFEVWNLFGYTGLSLLRVTVFFICMGLVWSLMAFRTNVFGLVVLVILSVALSSRLLVRSDILTLLFIVSFGWITLKTETSGSNYLFLLPVLLVFWSNINGTYLFGLILFVAFGIGHFFDRLIGRSSPKRMSVVLLLILPLTVLGTTFVKPAPDYTLPNRIHQINELFLNNPSGKSNNRTDRDQNLYKNPQTVAGKELPAVLSVIKSLTHDLIDRPGRVQTSEWVFPLWDIWSHGSKTITFLALVPLLVIVFGGSCLRIKLQYLFPLIGALFLTFSFNRSVPFFPALAVPYFLALRQRNTLWYQDYTNRLKKFLSSNTLFWVRGVTIVILVFLLVIEIVLFTQGSLLTTFRLKNGPAEVGVGLTNYLRSTIPDYVKSKFRDQPVMTSPFVGSYLAFTWWPEKKIIKWTKTEAYKDSYWFSTYPLRDYLSYLRSNRIKLIITDEKMLISFHYHRFIAERLSNWNLVRKDGKMYLLCYCKITSCPSNQNPNFKLLPYQH